jgi:hypothetical protein
MRIIPYTETADPIRTKLRVDHELARCKQSKIDIVDPNLRCPYSDIEDPTREKLRTERTLPIFRKSSTLQEEAEPKNPKIE